MGTTLTPAGELPGVAGLRGRHFFTDQDFTRRSCARCSTWRSR